MQKPESTSKSRIRGGLALPLVILLLLVGGGILFALHKVVQSYRHQSTRFRDGEIAYFAARSALSLVEAQIEEVLQGKPPPPGPGRDFYDLLRLSPAGDLAGIDEGLPLPQAEDIFPPGIEGWLDAEVQILESTALDVPRPVGLPPDPREKRGVLEIHCKAEVGNTIRRMVVRRRFRVQSNLPPVLGRFSVLFGELLGTPEDLNALTYSPRLGLTHRSISRKLSWPIQVYPLPYQESDQAPLERYQDDPDQVVREGGWVALLGERPWVLNLCFGPGEKQALEEGFLVRNFPAVHPIPGTSLYGKTYRLGFARDILDLPLFHPELRAEIPDGSSLLRLSGDSRHPMPAVVLGRVFRRFLQFTKVSASEAGPFTSVHSARDVDTAEQLSVLSEQVSGGDEALLKTVMAQPVLEPYNRSFDAILSDQSLRQEGGRIDPRDTPFSPPNRLPDLAYDWVAASSGSGQGHLYPARTSAEGEAPPGAYALFNDGGDEFFRGELTGLLDQLGDYLAQSAVEVLSPDAGPSVRDQFDQNFLQGDDLSLSGILHLKTDRINLGPFHVVRGGTILVDGDVQVLGPITTARGETLSIVSRKGTLKIENPEPIAAQLISLEGQIHPSDQGLDVRGGLIARHFEVYPWLDLQGLGRVVYDPRLNPAREATRLPQLRVHLDPRREVVLKRR